MGWRTKNGKYDDGNGAHGEQKRMINGKDRDEKVAYRRERGDIKRGYWELKEPLTAYEEYELRNLNDFDKWEEVTTGDKNEN